VDLGEMISSSPTRTPTSAAPSFASPTQSPIQIGASAGPGNQDSQIPIIVGTSVAFGLLGLAFGLFVVAKMMTMKRNQGTSTASGEGKLVMMVPLTSDK